MAHLSSRRAALALTVLLGVILGFSAPAVAQEQDFLSGLFGGPGGRPSQPQIHMPFATEGSSQEFMSRSDAPRPRIAYGGGQAWCVRTCDGRYFPISGAGEQGRASACDSFCPASETRVVYGSNIDNAATDKGKSYSELPNAFRYRSELVAGCTCNGRDSTGLASIKVEDDPTLRKGDIVAGADGLVVANRGASRRSALNFSPVSAAVQARYSSAPAVASE